MAGWSTGTKAPHKGLYVQLSIKTLDDLGADRAEQLTHVSADGAQWIHGPFRQRAPQAVICLDPFHVVAWATGVEHVRRRMDASLRDRPPAAHGPGASTTRDPGSETWAAPASPRHPRRPHRPPPNPQRGNIRKRLRRRRHPTKHSQPPTPPAHTSISRSRNKRGMF